LVEWDTGAFPRGSKIGVDDSRKNRKAGVPLKSENEVQEEQEKTKQMFY